jgi:hypothetical protein
MISEKEFPSFEDIRKKTREMSEVELPNLRKKKKENKDGK